MLVVAVTIAASAIAFGSIHEWHNSDSLVPILVSLYKWEPFFWEQDRIGMLVPLAAIWIRNPLLNLVFQTWWNTFLTLSAFFLIARIVTSPDRSVFAGGVSATLFLCFTSQLWQFKTFGTSAPSHGYGLFAGGLVLALEAPRLCLLRSCAAALLLMIGAWVHPAAAFLLVPMVAARQGFTTRTLIIFGLAAFAFVFSITLSTFAPFHVHYQLLPVTEWPLCWSGLLANVYREGFLTSLHLVVLGVLVITSIIVIKRIPGGRTSDGHGFLMALCGAAAFVFMLGSVDWIRSQGLCAHYLIGAVIALEVGVACLCVSALHALLSSRHFQFIQYIAVVALPIVAVLVAQPGSMSHVRRLVDQTLGQRSREVIDADVTHLAGSYWTVWPVMFHSNLLLTEAHSERRVWGICQRCTPTREYWGAVPVADWRIAATPEELTDYWAAVVLEAVGIRRLRPIGRLSSFTVYAAMDRPPPSTPDLSNR